MTEEGSFFCFPWKRLKKGENIYCRLRGGKVASMRISKVEVRNLYGREKRLLCVLGDSEEQLAHNSGPS